jgi:hypothetical protein
MRRDHTGSRMLVTTPIFSAGPRGVRAQRLLLTTRA